jgi:hypothetical protein
MPIDALRPQLRLELEAPDPPHHMSRNSFARQALGLDANGSRLLRRRRFRVCLELIDRVLETRPVCRIIDIGGEPQYWANVADLLGPRPVHITLLNRTPLMAEDPGFELAVGDARDLSAFADLSFDLAHSNSVIEHFVQTPNFWFPVEPHCSTLFFHWVPTPVRVSMLMHKPRGNWGQAPDLSTAMRQIQSNNLLDKRMLATLFPDATIRAERILGFPKSWMAIRSPKRTATRERHSPT